MTRAPVKPARPRMHENRDLLPAVIDLCRLLGLRVAHFRPVQDVNGRWRTAVAGDGAGFPDLIIVGPGGQLVRELKSAGGTVEAEQQLWLDAFTAAGSNVKVWTDKDLLSGLITRELQAIRRPAPRVDVAALIRQRDELLALVGQLTRSAPATLRS